MSDGEATTPGSTFGPVPLTPTAFLDRSALVHANRVALVDAGRTVTYRRLRERATQLAGALVGHGIRPGDRVSVLAPNTSLALEAHFGVPYSGGVLNSLNVRLGEAELEYIVRHAGSRVLLSDHEHVETARAVAAAVGDVQVVVSGGEDDAYGAWLEGADPVHRPVEDEQSMITLNYTSGTTGRPKGVMYSHRGAYLQSLAMIAAGGLNADTTFLWTLPMFHCNGWCFPWAVTAAGGTHVALRHVSESSIWHEIRTGSVTHFNAAPTVLLDLAFGAGAQEGPAPRTLSVATGGAPPSPRLLARLEELNIDVTHLYGLTETYGPAVVCEWLPEWRSLDEEAKATFKARQGVGNLVGENVRVLGDDGADVPADGTTPGEVLLRGNNVMIGYFRDPDATVAACVDGWFRTGDVAVMHPDRYIELRDRLKDVIISGGENITSIEVEQALAAHPAVLECAVIAAPHERWGEVPVAFVTLQSGEHATAEELIEFVKSRIARFKAPKQVFFEPLPKTATGKIQKFELRSRLNARECSDPAV